MPFTRFGEITKFGDISGVEITTVGYIGEKYMTKCKSDYFLNGF